MSNRHVISVSIVTKQINPPGKHIDIPSLPSGFGNADAQANEFFVLWDSGAKTNTLIACIRQISPLALEIVVARLKHRDLTL